MNIKKIFLGGIISILPFLHIVSADSMDTPIWYRSKLDMNSINGHYYYLGETRNTSSVPKWSTHVNYSVDLENSSRFQVSSSNYIPYWNDGEQYYLAGDVHWSNVYLTNHIYSDYDFNKILINIPNIKVQPSLTNMYKYDFLSQSYYLNNLIDRDYVDSENLLGLAWPSLLRSSACFDVDYMTKIINDNKSLFTTAAFFPELMRHTACWYGDAIKLKDLFRVVIYVTDDNKLRYDLSGSGNMSGTPISAVVPDYSGTNNTYYYKPYTGAINGEIVLDNPTDNIFISIHNRTGGHYDSVDWESVPYLGFNPSDIISDVTGVDNDFLNVGIGALPQLHEKHIDDKVAVAYKLSTSSSFNSTNAWLTLQTSYEEDATVTPPISDTPSDNPDDDDIEVIVVKLDGINDNLETIISKLDSIIAKMDNINGGTVNNYYTEINNVFNNETDKSVSISIHDNTIEIKQYNDRVDESLNDLNIPDLWNDYQLNDGIWYDPSVTDKDTNIFGSTMNIFTQNSLINTYLIGVLIIALISVIL